MHRGSDGVQITCRGDHNAVRGIPFDGIETTKYGEAVIVGDRLSTDIAMSRALGMTSVLVLSGATTGAELADSPHRPDYVIDGIAALLPAGSGEPASVPAARPRGSSR